MKKFSDIREEHDAQGKLIVKLTELLQLLAERYRATTE
jgi:hypothetical protein